MLCKLFSTKIKVIDCWPHLHQLSSKLWGLRHRGLLRPCAHHLSGKFWRLPLSNLRRLCSPRVEKLLPHRGRGAEARLGREGGGQASAEAGGGGDLRGVEVLGGGQPHMLLAGGEAAVDGVAGVLRRQGGLYLPAGMEG